MRAQNVTPQAPSFGKTLAKHVHCADADLVDRSDIPAEMMMARSIRECERHQVMIASVYAVKERDIVAGTVGQAHAQHARIKLNRLPHVARKQQDMGEPPRPRARDLTPEWRPTLAGKRRLERETGLFVRRRFGGNFDFNQIAVVIVEPQAVRLDAGRRIKAFDSHGLQALGKSVDVFLERAERHIAVLLARPLSDRSPLMRVIIGVHRQKVVLSSDFQGELAVEILRDGKVRHDKVKMIDGMDAEFAWPAARLNESLDRRHGINSLTNVIVARSAPHSA